MSDSTLSVCVSRHLRLSSSPAWRPSLAVCDDLAVRDFEVRHRVHAIALPSEIGEFADEVRRIFRELGRAFGAESLAGECAPAIDVYETDDALEVVVDLPGIDPSAVRIIAKGDAVLIAGDKAARRARGESSFHLVERGYGRFARVVRLGRACDVAKARATLAHGELHVSIPKIADRRGKAIAITVTANG
jgi:HSP20 family protein